jgi:CD63 antigen
MGICDNIFKNIVFLCNFVFFLTSLALIGIGAYIQIHMSKYLDFLGSTYLNTSIILIIIGGVMLLVTFCGCCGACTENHCMMYTYGTMLALILLSLVGVAITIYVYKV